MQILFTIYFTILGAVLGSFYNVVGLRVPKGKLTGEKRSHCPNCGNQLLAVDMIPVFSFLILGGKCRHCKTKISAIYPIAELITGLLFGYSFYLYGFSIELLLAFALISLAAILFVSDMAYMLIPNKILLFLFPIFFVLRCISPLDPWWASLTGATIAFALLAAIIILSKGGMGGGDLKLFVLLGFLFGPAGFLLTFFLASVIGACISLFLVWFKVVSRKQAVPFGPYILLASLIVYFYGEAMIRWYLESFF